VRLENRKPKNKLWEIFAYLKDSRGEDILVSASHCLQICELDPDGLSRPRSRVALLTAYTWKYLLQQYQQLDPITRMTCLHNALIYFVTKTLASSFNRQIKNFGTISRHYSKLSRKTRQNDFISWIVSHSNIS
jgi:hypothetical protein